MDWKDSPSLVLPMVYDVSSNITQIAERRDPVQSIATSAASHQLRRFAEYPTHHGECSLFPAVRDLIMNLTLPNEQQPNPNQVWFEMTFCCCRCASIIVYVSDHSISGWCRWHLSQSNDAFTDARRSRRSTRLWNGCESGTQLELGSQFYYAINAMGFMKNKLILSENWAKLERYS